MATMFSPVKYLRNRLPRPPTPISAMFSVLLGA
jgi:hypothetical protein